MNWYEAKMGNIMQKYGVMDRRGSLCGVGVEGILEGPQSHSPFKRRLARKSVEVVCRRMRVRARSCVRRCRVHDRLHQHVWVRHAPVESILS